MPEKWPRVVVAGHTCLDIIPTFEAGQVVGEVVFVPGTQVRVGPAVIATGGAVSNTGLALHRLGVPVRLVGKTGADLFGRAIVDVFERYDRALASDIVIDPAGHTAYTLVISPPNRDRMFLHYPGLNHEFQAADVSPTVLEGASLLHFGYPPAMRRMYMNHGEEMACLFKMAKAKGLTTSLDMSWPDPQSEGGQQDWVCWFEHVLPSVDLILPSLEETVFMLERERFDQWRREARLASTTARTDGDHLAVLSERLLGMGVAVVVLKLGDQGLYLRTTSDPLRMARLGLAALNPQAWAGRELLAPAFRVNVIGTTGAGDCTIAGFLAAILQDLSPEAVLTCAAAVGACNVEQADAVSGVPSWEVLQSRIAAGWERLPTCMALPAWHWDADSSVWRGPHDGR